MLTLTSSSDFMIFLMRASGSWWVLKSKRTRERKCKTWTLTFDRMVTTSPNSKPRYAGSYAQIKPEWQRIVKSIIWIHATKKMHDKTNLREAYVTPLHDLDMTVYLPIKLLYNFRPLLVGRRYRNFTLTNSCISWLISSSKNHLAALIIYRHPSDSALRRLDIQKTNNLLHAWVKMHHWLAPFPAFAAARTGTAAVSEFADNEAAAASALTIVVLEQFNQYFFLKTDEYSKSSAATADMPEEVSLSSYERVKQQRGDALQECYLLITKLRHHLKSYQPLN